MGMDLKGMSALKKEIQTDTDSLVLGLHLYEFSKDAFFFVSFAGWRSMLVAMLLLTKRHHHMKTKKHFHCILYYADS